jgi:putative transposase
LIQDKRRWLQWLFKAKKRYGLVILNYTVTSNHIHLLVFDEKGKNVIPDSVKLVAGRTGQEYNVRKNRKGAFWEDRYHATAIESQEHLFKCLTYIDLNMVRNGVVAHPSQWPFGGYNEIQKPRRKNVLIAYKKLTELAGFESYDTFQEAHREMVNESLANGNNQRQKEWTESIAVGSQSFSESIKEKLGVRAKGRKIIETDVGFQLREEMATYSANYDQENGHIGLKNTCLWDI